MSAGLLFCFIIGYFFILLLIAYLTSKKSTNDSFFNGNKNSNWFLVAFGMIGTSLSGVTFVSVPGMVGQSISGSGGIEGFAYFQLVIGYLFGYLVIAFVLLPLYYKLQLTSIYNYLDSRLGTLAYKTGASFFILSRTLGATARLYLVIAIIQNNILQNFGIPFWLTTLIIILMILLYTLEGGVKTIVWTDALQTLCMLAGLVICLFYLLKTMDLNLFEAFNSLSEKGYTRIFVADPQSRFFFLKQVLAGAFITIAMTGMDQEMMQKNISIRTLKGAQKNMLTFSVILLIVNFLFLLLGGVLYVYAAANGMNATGDRLFPFIALGEGIPGIISVIFIIALISALFPSADGAITALTSSFCIDLLGMNRKPLLTEPQKKKIRRRVHLSFSFIFLLFVLFFKWIDNSSMISLLLKIAGYTYGPLLGLFAFGILTKRSIRQAFIPAVVIAAPFISFLMDHFQAEIFGGFEIGLELLVINGLLTFVGLLCISKKTDTEIPLKASPVFVMSGSK